MPAVLAIKKIASHEIVGIHYGHLPLATRKRPGADGFLSFAGGSAPMSYRSPPGRRANDDTIDAEAIGHSAKGARKALLRRPSR